MFLSFAYQIRGKNESHDVCKENQGLLSTANPKEKQHVDILRSWLVRVTCKEFKNK